MLFDIKYVLKEVDSIIFKDFGDSWLEDIGVQAAMRKYQVAKSDEIIIISKN